MERSYTYFKNLLNESMDALNQIKLKAELLNEFKESLEKKVLDLNDNVDRIRKVFLLDNDETIVDKLNHIKLLQTSLGEKDEIIKGLKNKISTLNYEVSSRKNETRSFNDDLPF